MTDDPIPHLLALAARLEGEGQLNNSKLLYAAVDSLNTRAAHRLVVPPTQAAMLAETDRAMERLASLDMRPEFMAAMARARAAQADRRLAHYTETPDPTVCRTCGYLALEETAICPQCGAHAATFRRHRPTYWLETFDPFESLEILRSTPVQLAALLDGVPDSVASEVPEDGGWNLFQAITHLRDAQGVIAFRVGLMLEQDNPQLKSQAVFAWAAKEAGRKAGLGEIFDAYAASRSQMLERLEALPIGDWWRRGRHEEFGEMRLYEQVSYFACHELTHIPQIGLLLRA